MEVNRPRLSRLSTLQAVADGGLAGRLSVDLDALRDFCRRWDVTELALFGSVLRPDFRPESDVDILVRWAPDAGWGLLDHARMEEELEQIFGRKVDLLSRRALEASSNWLLRHSILNGAEVIYGA